MSDARQCPSCGAAVDLPPGRLTDACAFCESALVALSGDGEPVDRVVPFVLTRERAAGRLRQHLKGRWLAPGAAARAADPSALQAVYVPFWSYDGVARSGWSANLGVRPGGRGEPRWTPLAGKHVLAVGRHLVSGSRGLPEREANALEPFDLGRARPWTAAAVAGQLAERPNVSHAEARDTLAKEAAEAAHKAIRRFLSADEVRDLRNDTALTLSAVELVLVPVWIATWGKGRRFLVNGQTGEVVGAVPVSPTRIAVLGGLLVAMLGCAGAFLPLLMALPWR